MKKIITLLALITGLVAAGCASDNEDHSHGPDGDHTHEQPAQQSSGENSDATRIGGGADTVDVESDHSHDEDSDHSHEDEHNPADDSTHSHGDEEHSH